MKKIKIIMISLLFIFTIILTVPNVFAYKVNSIPSKADYVMTVNTQYQPTISNQGDITLDDGEFNTFNQMFDYLAIEYPSEIGIIQIPLRYDSNFTIYNSSNTVMYFYENVRMITIIYDMYVNQASTKITYYLYSSNGTLITTFNYTWNVTTQTYYYLMTYEYNIDFQSGYNIARSEYGYYSGGVWYTATQQYNSGYSTAKTEFGLRNGIFGNANYWFSQGQLSDVDFWGSLLSAFFGVFQVLSIEILPGIELGYFVGFFLILSVTSMIIGSMMIRRK